MIAVLPPSARPRTACQTQNTPESACPGLSCSVITTSSHLHLIPSRRILSRMTRAERPRRTNRISGPVPHESSGQPSAKHQARRIRRTRRRVLLSLVSSYDVSIRSATIISCFNLKSPCGSHSLTREFDLKRPSRPRVFSQCMQNLTHSWSRPPLRMLSTLSSTRLYYYQRISFSCKRYTHLFFHLPRLTLCSQYLLETNGEIAPPPRKRVKLDREGDYAGAVSASSKALAEMESAYAATALGSAT